VAADLDETITLLKNTIGAHEGVNLNIEAAVAPIPLDTDVEGFETIAVSYFTVQPILFEGLTSRMLPVCMGISSVIFMDLGVFTRHMGLMSLLRSLIYWRPLKDTRSWSCMLYSSPYAVLISSMQNILL